METSTQKHKNSKMEAMRNRIKLNTPLITVKHKQEYLQVASPSPCTPHHDLLSSPNPFKFEGFTNFTNLSESNFYLKNAFEQEYQILEKLGQGANGIVSKCRNRITQQIQAVKIGQMDEEHMLNLKRTVKFMEKLSHQNILKCKQLYHDSKRHKYYHVIQYIPHPSLKSHIHHKQKFSVLAIKKIMKQLFSALQYFHKHHIAHRDIKTSNILYDKENEKLTVIDLGIITKTVHRGKRRNLWSNNGTLEYKAPQMLLGSSYNESVDNWAAGVVLFELIQGKTPFRQESHFDIIDNITEIKYSFNPELWKQIPLAKQLVTMLLKPKNNRLTAREAKKAPWFQEIDWNQKPIKKIPQNKQLVGKQLDLVNSSSTPFSRVGFAGSMLIVKNPNQYDIQDFDDIDELTISHPYNLRMSSYQSNIQKQTDQLSLSAILGTKQQKMIINNNN